MNVFKKPVVVVSRCLEFAACRYDGARIEAQFIRELEPFVEFIPVCPEVEIGLPIPRDPICIVQTDTGLKLIQPSTGQDFTSQMLNLAEGFLSELKDVDGFILKSRSPSCGIEDCKLFAPDSLETPIGTISGFFASKVLESFPKCRVVSEQSMQDPNTRQDFLQQIFTAARERAVIAME